jgi:hypothetical protein
MVRTRNHTLLSNLRLPQHGGPGSRIYISQEQGGPVVSPGTGFCIAHCSNLLPSNGSQDVTVGTSVRACACLRVCVYVHAHLHV